MILIDANVLMYAAGADHPHKKPSAEFLRAVARGDVEAATDTEVLQEILNRYRALNRWEDGRRVYDLARRVIPNVIPVTVAATDAARELMDVQPALSARDAVHAAVALTKGLDGIVSYDRDLDGIEGVDWREP